MKKDTLQKLVILAAHARDNAYCPYSGFQVGVALESDSGRVYLGANVETAHYKAVCAEASAISAMIAAGERKIRTVVVIGPDNGQKTLCTPCGDCRQRLFEFSDAKTEIYSLWSNGKIGKKHKIKDLLPYAFGPDNLLKIKKGKTKKK